MYVVLDLETTGLNSEEDEILQVSIIDQDNNILIDEYCKPNKVKSWNEAENINNITPEMVENKKPFEEYINVVNDILSKADRIIIYNAPFEINFLRKYGISIDSAKVYDLMVEFSEKYGEWNDYFQSRTWVKLETCCNFYGYYLENAHNSLEDCKATLYCYKKFINNVGGYNGEEYLGKTLREFIECEWRKLDHRALELRVYPEGKNSTTYIRGSVRTFEDIPYKEILDYEIEHIIDSHPGGLQIWIKNCEKVDIEILKKNIEQLIEKNRELEEEKAKINSMYFREKERANKLKQKLDKLKETSEGTQKEKIIKFNSYGFYTAEYCKSTKKPMISREDYSAFSKVLLSKTRCAEIKQPVKEDEKIYAFLRVRNGYCALYYRSNE
ncbi:3'-5' exonuclease [Gemella morbillorum]